MPFEEYTTFDVLVSHDADTSFISTWRISDVAQRKMTVLKGVRSLAALREFPIFLILVQFLADDAHPACSRWRRLKVRYADDDYGVGTLVSLWPQHNLSRSATTMRLRRPA